MVTVFPFDELKTDASSTVIKLVRDLKEKYSELMDLFHSLDIWQKAKKLSKTLHQDTWVGALYHVCGEHS